MKILLAALERQPVIAAVRETKHVDAALASRIGVIFMMGGNLLEIQEITEKTHAAGKHILLHVELIKGLGRDREGIEYLARHVKPEGVVSTKPQLLRVASKLGLISVLQIFMIDTQAYVTGLKNIQTSRPDAVEIMPGLMPGIIARIKEQVEPPLITAGLVKHPDEVRAMCAAGASGVAISEQSLWDFKP